MRVRLVGPRGAEPPEKVSSAVRCAACGAIAGGVAAWTTTPFDFLKTRIILAEGQQGAVQIAAEALRTEGVRRLWSGATARTALISVGGCVFFGAYEVASVVLRTL